MAVDEGSRTQQVIGDDFLSTEILRGTFLQIIVEFDEISVRNTTSENAREVDTKTPNVLVKCNGYSEMFSLSGAVEISGPYLLIRTFIIQKTVVGCPTNTSDQAVLRF